MTAAFDPLCATVAELSQRSGLLDIADAGTGVVEFLPVQGDKLDDLVDAYVRQVFQTVKRAKTYPLFDAATAAS